MASTLPIGIIDSGIGGLSFVRALYGCRPQERILYIADTAFFPYGQLAPEKIRERVSVLSDFLLSKGAKAIVIACNTATANGIDTLRTSISIPVVGVEPPVKPAVMSSVKKRIGVLTTPATARSERFRRLIQLNETTVQIITQPCTGLAEAIETSSPELSVLIKSYLGPILAKDVDALVLGCTHYQLVADQIMAITDSAGKGIRLFEPSTGTLSQLLRVLTDRKLQSDEPAPATVELYSTGEAEPFFQAAAPWLLSANIPFTDGELSPPGGKRVTSDSLFPLLA